MATNFDKIADIEVARMKKENKERESFTSSFTRTDIERMKQAVDDLGGTEQIPDAAERFERITKLLKLAVISGESAITYGEIGNRDGHSRNGLAWIDLAKDAYFVDEQLRVTKQAIMLSDDLSITAIGIPDAYENDNALTGANSNVRIRIAIGVQNIWK